MTKRIFGLVTGWIFVFGLTYSVFAFETVQVQVQFDNYGSECSWEIINMIDGSQVVDGSGTSNQLYSTTIFVEAGEYEFRAYDSAGDGWSATSGWYQVTPASGIATGQVNFTNGSEKITPFSVYSSSANDIGIISLITPVTGPGLTATENVSVLIRNYGTTSASGFSLSYSLNGGTSFVTETVSASVSSGDSLVYTFSQSANVATPGTYEVVIAGSLLNDANETNDTLEVEVESISSISTFPWLETFSNWPLQDWTLDGANAWASYQGNAAYCNFLYWSSGNAELISPPVNLNNPGTLSFDWSSDFYEFFIEDSLQVYISNDNGTSWDLIWSKAGVELSSNDGASFSSPGSYITETIDLSAYAGDIIFVKFNGVTGYGPNLFLDNVGITLNPVYDLSVVDLISPSGAGCELSTAENITIRVKNFGAVNVSSYTLKYSVDGGSNYITETVNALISSGSYIDYTFNTPANLSVVGDYSFIASVVFSSDLNSSNDNFETVISSLDVLDVNNGSYTEDFELGYSTMFALQSNDYSDIAIADDGSNKVLKFDGGIISSNWVGITSTTEAQAWDINTAHQSEAYTCQIDASSLTSVELLLDLKQYYKFSTDYSWFRVLVNGVPVADNNGTTNFHPVTEFNDPFQQLRFDLSSVAGTQFELSLQACNRYNSSTSYAPGNVAFVDNVIVREIPPPDAAVGNITAPVSSCDLSSSEPITVEINNVGGTDISNFDISFSIDNGTVYTETFTGTIISGSSDQYTFTQTADLSAISQYSILIEVDLSSDQNAANDSLTFMVEHLSPTILAINGLGSSYCLYDSPVSISGSPSGGTFSGNGIDGSTFDPSLAGNGTHTITYSYEDVITGCISTADQLVQVSGSEVSFSGLYTGNDSLSVLVKVFYDSYFATTQSWEIVDEYGVVHLSMPIGGGNGYSYNGYIDLPLGNYTFIAYSDQPLVGWLGSWYEITPEEGMAIPQTFFTSGSSKSSDFSVVGIGNYCLNSVTIALTGSPSGGIFTGNGISNNSFEPFSAGTGTHNITYTYNDNGCIGSETQQVMVIDIPTVELGPTIESCEGESVILDAGSGSSYIWNNGSANQTLTVTQAGIYSVTVSNSGGCEASDSVEVVFNSAPVFELGNNQDACLGSVLVLDAGLADSYLWSTGASTQTISVNTTGTYEATITVNGCEATDDISVTFHEVQLNLGNDIELCEGDDYLIDAGTSYSSYLWGDNSTASALLVNQAGTYFLTVSDQYGCQTNDSVQVIINALPVVSLGPDTTIDDEIIHINAGQGFSSYLWSNGLTSPIIIVDGSSMIDSTYYYWVEVTDVNGCVGTDTIAVIVEDVDDVQEIPLPSGWSIFSTYIIPFNPNIADVLFEIKNNITIVKDGNGNPYWPSYNYNGIGDMILGTGYQILTTLEDTLYIAGTQVVPEDTTISIPSGWSILGYLRSNPDTVGLLMSPIINELIILKSGNGDVYWPLYGVDGIHDMMPGEGYQMKTSAQVNYTYPPNGSLGGSKSAYHNEKTWSKFRTDNNMTLAIPMDSWKEIPDIGDRVVVKDQTGRTCGEEIFNGDLIALTIWGYDNINNTSGAKENEEYNLYVVSSTTGLINKLHIESYFVGDGYYEVNDLEVAAKVKILKQTADNLDIVCYPNPVREQLNINLNMPEADHLEISLFDLTGKKVKTIVNTDFQVGIYSLNKDVSDVSSGQYILKAISGKELFVQHVNIIK